METKALHVGDPAPDFELIGDEGKPVRLSDFRGKRVILYFYPKDDTPGCTTQACGFRDAYPDIQDRNAAVIGISPDSTASHQKFKTKYGLPFILLSDPDHTVAERYGAWGPKTTFGVKTTGIIRSHFVIDENGTLTDIQTPVSPKDSIERALGVLPT